MELVLAAHNALSLSDIIYRYMYDNCVADIKYDALLRQIRGEKWIAKGCLNCYIYGDMTGLCLNHISDLEDYKEIQLGRMSLCEFMHHMNSMSFYRGDIIYP